MTLFIPAGWESGTLISFWLADAIVVVLGSLLAGLAVSKNATWSMSVIWFVLGGTTYAALYCVAISLQTRGNWLSTTLMTAMLGANLVAATSVSSRTNSAALFIQAHMNVKQAVAWTMFQLSLFWLFFLVVAPMGILEVEQLLGWRSQVAHSSLGTAHALGSVIIFMSGSALGLWSAFTMAIRGKGTPLPVATASQLVISGPYFLLRNPMAVAGTVQGVAVGWWLQSISVVALAIISATFWHFVIRPLEETDLRMRFGQQYEHYCNRTLLWLPTFGSYYASAKAELTKDHRNSY